MYNISQTEEKKKKGEPKTEIQKPLGTNKQVEHSHRIQS